MKYKLLLISLYAVVLAWSVIHPHDYFTWVLETFPALVGFAVLIATYRKFQFTNLVYTLIVFHCCVLFIGGHYTYALEPLFARLREIFHWERNNYDKLGHFLQGFVPAFVAREIYVRKDIVRRGAWTAVLTVATCLSISLLYELLEWFMAIVSGQHAEGFLGTQGDPWDTQTDMAFAFLGALVMVLLFSRMHDRAIGRAEASPSSGEYWERG
jgi:putative membrane protein